MKTLRMLLEGTQDYINKRASLRRLRPLAEAIDEFFFATCKITKFTPHILDSIDIKRYMSFVILALLPVTIAAIYFYSLRILAIILVSYAFGGLTEAIFSIIRRKPLYEGFLVTGLIFPLILPPSIPLWMVAVGIVFGVFFGKEVFGGTGRNIFNPALVGRVFLSLAFPEYFASMWNSPFLKGWGGFAHYIPDAITQATPLINYKTTHAMTSYASLFLGMAPGSIGETFRLGIIIGGLFLIIVKIIDWRIPLSYLLSVGFFSFLLHNIAADKFAPAIFQILSGGLLFGAFFMATDPVTSPLSFEGKWIYGILLGVFTVLIRGLSGFPEGVMFAILLMNAVAPFIDIVVLNIKFRSINYERKT